MALAPLPRYPMTMRDPQMTNYTPRLTQGVTPEEILPAHDRTVACDGGGGALGHPRVMLRITDSEVTCPYCSRTYRLVDGAGDDHGH